MPQESLQIEQDLRFQQRAWVVQRVGWVGLLLAIGAGISGVFGAGPWSSATVDDGKKIKIEYERFVHYSSPTVVKIHLRAGAEDNPIYLGINSDFVQAVKLENIAPQPSSVETEDRWLRYKFAAKGPGEVTIRFDLTPETVGTLVATIDGGTGAPLSFRQFVFP